MKKFNLRKEHLDSIDDASSAPLLVLMFGFVLFLVIVNIVLATLTANYLSEVYNLGNLTLRAISWTGSILIMSNPYMKYTYERTDKSNFSEELFKQLKMTTHVIIATIAISVLLAIVASAFFVGDSPSANWSNLLLHVFLHLLNIGIDFIAGVMLMIKVQVLLKRDSPVVEPKIEKFEKVKHDKQETKLTTEKNKQEKQEKEEVEEEIKK